MNFSKIIKEVGRGKNHYRNLDYDTAYKLYYNILSGHIPELELGGLLIAFRIKTETIEEILGFYQAVKQHLVSLQAPKMLPMPIVIPSYNGARKQANLTPLLAIVLANFGFPVIVHGLTTNFNRVTSAEIFKELGIPWITNCTTIQHNLLSLKKEPIFIPIEFLSPKLFIQLNLYKRLGVRNSAHILAKLITPFLYHPSLQLCSVSHPSYMSLIKNFFITNKSNALLMHGTEGETYMNPRRLTYIYHFKYGIQQILLNPNIFDLSEINENLPECFDAGATAKWIESCLRKKSPLPKAICLQISCCLIAAGKASNIQHALELINHLALY